MGGEGGGEEIGKTVKGGLSGVGEKGEYGEGVVGGVWKDKGVEGGFYFSELIAAHIKK